MITLRLLGAVELTAEGRTVASVTAQPKRLALLAFLAAAAPRGAHRRDRLLALFWPDSPEDRARNSLNQAIFQLRRSLGEGVVQGSGEELCVDRALLWCDVVAFEAALAAGDAAAALDLYGGDLLPAFHVSECADFDHWLQLERERLRQRAVEAARALAAQEARRGNGVAAIERLRRASGWAPHDEGVTRELVTLLAEYGDTAGALREFDRLRELLAAEYELEPDPETWAVAEAARQRGTPATRQTVEVHAAPGEEPAAGSEVSIPAGEGGTGPAPEAPVPTVGRRRRTLLAAALITLLAAAAAAGMLWPGSGTGSEVGPPPPVLDARRVLVAAFDNQTGEPALDPVGYMAADWLAHAFALSGMVRVVPFSTIVQETSAERSGARDVALRVGAGLLMSGAYYRIGADLVFRARLVDTGTGEMLRGMEAVAAGPADPAAALRELQERALGTLAAQLDERLRTWPEPGAQPTSLDAYRLFADGMNLYLSANRSFGSPAGAVTLEQAAARFMEAAALDTAFSTALVWAGFAWFGAGDEKAARAVNDALQARQLPPWNRAVVEHQRALLDGDAEATYRTALPLADLSPDSEWLFKLGFAALRTRRTITARDVLLRIDPEHGWIREFPSYWRVRAEVHHALGEHAAGLAAARRALELAPDDAAARAIELWALGALGRWDEIGARIEARLAADDPLAVRDLTTTIEELRAHGHRRAADRLLGRLLPVAAAAAAEAAAPVRFNFARLLEHAGRHAEAQAHYARVLEERPQAVEPRVRLAIIAARAGSAEPARDVDAWLASLSGDALLRAAPADLHLYWGTAPAWLALTRARLAAARGDRDAALDLLQQAVAAGLRHTHWMLHDDADFTVLRRDPRLLALLAPRD